MKTLTVILATLLSAVSPTVVAEEGNTQLNSNIQTELNISMKADWNSAGKSLAYEIEDEIANLERINENSRNFMRLESLNHVQHLVINSRSFKRSSNRSYSAE